MKSGKWIKKTAFLNGFTKEELYTMQLEGFADPKGVNYNEIFSTIAMLKFVRIMLAVAIFYEIWQMDVKTAFLKWISLRRVVYDATRRFR